MTDNAISLKGIGKTFRVPLDRSTTLKYRVTHPRSTSRYRVFEALKDITFDVPRGQFLGITGPNGCGKSTLLKILSRIYEPDGGTMVVADQVSPFLELGVGFNPELTARENIFLGGAVLGLTRAQLRTRVDSILDFADLTQFADQKLKNFSSGMQVRLAFTVAIQANAGILLMDEVLAVGDARFQEKCFDIFARYKREGRTVVLVTHDLGSLDQYCDRVLLINDGRLIADGPASAVTAEYRRKVGHDSEEDDASKAAEAGATNRWGSRHVEITSVRLLDDTGAPRTTLTTGSCAVVEVAYAVRQDVDGFTCGLAFKRNDGLILAGPNTLLGDFPLRAHDAGATGVILYRIEELQLLGGSYLLTAAIYDAQARSAYDHVDDVLAFRVVDERGRHGVIELDGRWSAGARVTAHPL